MALFQVLNGVGINGAGVQFGSLSQIAASGLAAPPSLAGTIGVVVFNDGGSVGLQGSGMAFSPPFILDGTATALQYDAPGPVPVFRISQFSEPLQDLDVLLAGGAGELAALADLFSEADTISGSNVNDRLMGFAGADTLDGGAGTDTLSYQGSTAGGVTMSLVDGSIGVGGDAQGDVVSGFENLVGSELADNLTGNAGSNILVGRLGADVMAGGGGNDTYDVDNANDVILEDAGGGADTVYASVSYALGGALVEKLAAFSTGGAIDLTGNGIAQTIIGNGSNNRIDGDGLGDGLYGGGGDDVFDYNAASDSAPGVGNVDTIRDFSAGDLIDLEDVSGETLSFIGTGPYTAANQVRYTSSGNTFVLRVNLDADLVDEMQIYVVGVAAPVAGDLVL
jgi:Ca2+-binding RTX toxin-like protein